MSDNRCQMMLIGPSIFQRAEKIFKLLKLKSHNAEAVSEVGRDWNSIYQLKDN